MGLSVLDIKIISTIVLFILSLLGGIAPYWIRNLSSGKRFLSWSNTFAGGVFFSAGMLHLFASTEEDLLPYTQKYKYPFAPLCLCIGFLFTLFLELIINSIFIKSNTFASLHGHSHSHVHTHAHAHAHIHTQNINSNSNNENNDNSNDNNNSNKNNETMDESINLGMKFRKIMDTGPTEKQKLLDSTNSSSYNTRRITGLTIDIDKSGYGFNNIINEYNDNIIDDDDNNNNNNNGGGSILTTTTTTNSENINPLNNNNNNNNNISDNKSLSYRHNGCSSGAEDEEPDIIIDYDDIVGYNGNGNGNAYQYQYQYQYHQHHHHQHTQQKEEQGRTRGNSGSSESSVNNDKEVLINKNKKINNNNSNNSKIDNNGIIIDSDQDIIIVSKKNNILLPFLLVVALSIHSLFEGLAMGVQSSQMHFFDILIAIFAHKILASFALGVSTVTSSFEKPSFLKLFLLVLVFSLTSPIGSIIGMIIVGSGVSDSLVPPILQGIASGTFLYVAVVEVIPKELSHDSNDILIKSLLLLLGFGGMAAVAVFV